MSRTQALLLALGCTFILSEAKDSERCAALDAAFLNVSNGIDPPACRCYASPVRAEADDGSSPEFWIGCNGQSMPSVFRSLHAIEPTSVEHLFIWDSLINILPAEMFSQVSPRTLTIESSGVSVFRDGAFNGLQNLKKLHLRRNIFKSIDDKLFTGTPSLELLDLSNNKLSAIDNGTFAPLRQLRSLSLHGNSIERLNDGCFEGLSSLTRLDLSDNRISEISSGAFDGLTSLEELNLKGNNIAEMNWSALSKLPSLRILDLGDNKLSKIELAGLEKLERLALDNNDVTSLKSVQLSHLPSLKMLSLDHNRISRVDAEDFAGLVESQQLSALSLGHNSISTIDGRAFKYVPNVSTLWLSNNDLTSLDGSANAGAIDEEASAMYLSPLLKLQRLFISHNRLQKLPNSFNKLTQLELIALNNNHLNEVEREAFNGLQPKMLFLNNNSLYYLPEGLFSSFRLEDLVSVDLSGNPWECICGREWLGSWLESIGDANTAQSGLGCLAVRCAPSENEPRTTDQSWITYIAVALAFITLSCMFAIGYLLMKEYSFGRQPLFTLRRVPSDMVQLIPEGLSYPNPVITLPEPGNTCLKNGAILKGTSSSIDKKHVRFNGV